jgi:hypothetical protein
MKPDARQELPQGPADSTSQAIEKQYEIYGMGFAVVRGGDVHVRNQSCSCWQI